MDRPPPRHLQEEDSPAAKQETSSDELAQRPVKLPVANEWRQLRNTAQSTDLAFLGRARHQYEDWFDDDDAVIDNLFTDKNRVYKDYDNCPTDPNKVAFYRSRRLVQQWLQEMPDAWIARKAEEIQEYADRKEGEDFFAVYGDTAKGTDLLLSVDGTTLITEIKVCRQLPCHASENHVPRSLVRAGTFLAPGSLSTGVLALLLGMAARSSSSLF
ncbi:hypothetical protein SprV_0702392100 [Sparganum proliferum]